MRKTLFFFCFLPITADGASDSYRLLGVLPGHSSENIDLAFQRIKFRIHPHRHGGNQEAKERFQELEEAYNNLQDPVFQTRYDSYMRENGHGLKDEPNLYKVLGVLSDADPSELTRAYRETRRRVHPDTLGGDDPLANDRFKEVQKAFKTLLDPVLRAQHDRQLKGTGTVLTYDTDWERRMAASRGEQPVREKPESAQADRSNFSQQRNGQGSNQPTEPQFPFTAKGKEDSLVLADAVNEQIFQLAKELEKSEREEDLKEAIEWYRLLVREENHVEAIKRLAILLERFDMNEALYRYRQAEALSADDGDFARFWAFRQAQFYQKGVSVNGNTLFPKDPEESVKLYERAFQLGADPRDIAGQYEKIGDWTGALKWWSQDRNLATDNTGKKLKKKRETEPQGLANFKWNDPYHSERSDQGFPKEDGDISLAIRHQSPFYSPHQEKEEKVLAIVHRLIETGADINKLGWNKIPPIRLALGDHYYRVVQLLISSGADVNLPDGNGDIALNNALGYYNYFDFHRTFQIDDWSNKKKFQVNLNNEEKETQRQIIFSLVEKSDLSFRNKEGKLPLQIAIERGHSEAAVWILQKMGRQKILGEREKTQLTNSAVKKGYVEVIQILQEAPVNENADSFIPRLASSCRSLFAGFKSIRMVD